MNEPIAVSNKIVSIPDGEYLGKWSQFYVIIKMPKVLYRFRVNRAQRKCIDMPVCVTVKGGNATIHV